MRLHDLTQNPRARHAGLFVLRQCRQKSTIAAIVNAVVLLVGVNVDPTKLDSIALLLSVADSILLAVVQEHQPGQPDDGRDNGGNQ